MNINAYLPQLTTTFERHGVRVAHLFGSYAKGTARRDSDLDIAVLFKQTPPDSRQRFDLIGDLTDIFGRDDVDVVILNDAPNLLAYAVLRHGVILYNVDERLRVNFQVRTLQTYQDLAPMRCLFRETFIKRLKRGKFGQRSRFAPMFPKVADRLTKGALKMTIDQDIIHNRLHAIENYTAVLRQYQSRTLDEISADTGTAWAIEHGLQLCIQCAIDVCNHLVAELNLGMPATHHDAVELLIQNGILSADLGATLIEMFRFRNILVHHYLEVDLNIVYEILRDGLDDFARFSEQVLEFLAQSS